MLPPRHPRKRTHTRTRWECPVCRSQGRASIVGRIHRRAHERHLLVTMPGATAHATPNPARWRIVCACGAETVFTGDDVVVTRQAQAA